MSQSGKKYGTARRYLFAAIFCAVFSAVYEAFSHGVYSIPMLTLALYPLLLGALPFFALGALNARPGFAARHLWHTGVATLALGSCLAGVFEIYGSASEYVAYYRIAGLALLGLGLLTWAASLFGRGSTRAR